MKNFQIEQLNLISYEIAMSIGESLNLELMLQTSLSTYLKRLGCFAGSILQLNSHDGYYQYGSTFSIPRSFHHQSSFKQLICKLPQKSGWNEIARFQQSLPQIIQVEAENNSCYIFELPKFGLLILFKSGEPLPEAVQKSLEPLNLKLAKACLSCLQNQAFIKSEQNYKRLFDNAAVGIFQCDLSGTITRANLSMARIFGVTDNDAELLVNQNIDLLLGTKFCEHCQENEKIIKIQIENQDSTSAREEGRDIRWLRVKCSKILSSEAQPEFLEGLIEDITERIRNDQLKIAKEIAESSNRTKSRFMANISHELKTPLNGILGMTSLLLDSETAETHRDHLEIIMKCGNDLLKIIRDILDFSRLEEQQLSLNNQSFCFDSVIKNLVESYRKKSEERNLKFSYLANYKSENNLLITGDADRICQIISNLLDNAFKFTHRGEVVLEICYNSEGDFLFNVIDTGIGINPQHYEDIFQGFTQVDDSSTRKYGGTGLGLAISRKLVKLMSGEIGVESQEGRGTRFWVSLPLKES